MAEIIKMHPTRNSDVGDEVMRRVFDNHKAPASIPSILRNRDLILSGAATLRGESATNVEEEDSTKDS